MIRSGRGRWFATALFLLGALTPPAGAETRSPAATLTLGVVQLALERNLADNRDKMLRFVRHARDKGCRVVVFPETALASPAATPRAERDAAVEVLRKAAAEHGVYLVFCVKYKRNDKDRPFERLLVIDPQGKILQTYDKLWGNGRQNVPGPFLIDGVPCAAAICADRWIRGVEELPALDGVQVLIECSNNYDNEWIDDLGWYWTVPRALRNQTYVVFANTAQENRSEAKAGHGHSAVIAPDGSVVTAAGEEADRLLVTTLDLARATRGQAVLRGKHPLFKPFWEAGVAIMRGRRVNVPSFEAHVSPEVSVRIAAAQLACSRRVADNLARMKDLVRTARAQGADVVVFPELAVTGARASDIVAADEAVLGSALAELQAIARREQVPVVFGMPWLEDGKRFNCAFVLGPDGALLTRYAQIVVDRAELFAPGTSTKALWFRVKGVPGVVTVGGDALWNEMAELAAVRGAQVHLHLSYDRDTSAAAALRRKQLWVNLASYWTLTATVNAASPDGLADPSEPSSGGSILWEDFRRKKAGPEGGYFPHSAVRLAEAKAGEQIIYATETVFSTNPHFGRLTGRTNPHMKPWYTAGAHAIDAALPAASLGR